MDHSTTQFSNKNDHSKLFDKTSDTNSNNQDMSNLDEEYSNMDAKKAKDEEKKTLSAEEKLANFNLKRKLVGCVADWADETTCR
jgi:hypothetical protein